MLTWEEDVEAHALRRQGWSISAIARHLGRDRKTIRGYLRGERTPGVRPARRRTALRRLLTTAGCGWLTTRTWVSGLLGEREECTSLVEQPLTPALGVARHAVLEVFGLSAR